MPHQIGDRVELVKDMPGHWGAPAKGQKGRVSYIGAVSGMVEVTWDAPTPGGKSYSDFTPKCPICNTDCRVFLVVQGGVAAAPAGAWKVGDQVTLTKDMNHTARPKAGWTGTVTALPAGGKVRVRWTNGQDTVFGGMCQYCHCDCTQYIQRAGVVATAPAAAPIPAATGVIVKANAAMPQWYVTPVPAYTTKAPHISLRLNVGDRVECTNGVAGTDLKTGDLGWIVGFHDSTRYSVVYDNSKGPDATRNWWRVTEGGVRLVAAAASQPVIQKKTYVCDCGGHHSGFKDFANVGHSDWCKGHASKAPMKKVG